MQVLTLVEIYSPKGTILLPYFQSIIMQFISNSGIVYLFQFKLVQNGKIHKNSGRLENAGNRTGSGVLSS
jgi:hypothetical protein